MPRELGANITATCVEPGRSYQPAHRGCVWHRLLLILLIFCATLCTATPSWAANRYWVGPSGGSFSDAANWSGTDPTSCTGGGAGVPNTADVAIFDGDCDNDAAIGAAVSVGGVSPTFAETTF
jgi:hypothetical protein